MKLEELIDTNKNNFLIKCLYPQIITIKSKDGEKFDRLIPCRQCSVCRKQIGSEWAQRLLYESSYYKGNCYFLTLTYDDINVPEKLNKNDWRAFFKAYRKTVKNKLKFFMCGEYGETTKRPHYHSIVFGDFKKDLYILGYNEEGKPKFSSKSIDKLWKKGSNQIGSASKKSMHYVTGYILKNIATEFEGFRLMSKSLGLRYAQDNKETIIARYKEDLAVPRYLCEKIEIPFDVIEDKKRKILEEFYEKYKGTEKTREYFLKIKDAVDYRNKLEKQKEDKYKRGKEL